MLAQSHMWDGSLSRIYKAKNSIDLTSQDIHHVHSVSYQAGLKTREFEKTEVDKMRHTNVIDPVKSEWASLVVFAPRKDGSLCLCIKNRKKNVVKVETLGEVREI